MKGKSKRDCSRFLLLCINLAFVAPNKSGSLVGKRNYLDVFAVCHLPTGHKAYLVGLGFCSALVVMESIFWYVVVIGAGLVQVLFLGLGCFFT